MILHYFIFMNLVLVAVSKNTEKPGSTEHTEDPDRSEDSGEFESPPRTTTEPDDYNEERQKEITELPSTNASETTRYTIDTPETIKYTDSGNIINKNASTGEIYYNNTTKPTNNSFTGNEIPPTGARSIWLILVIFFTSLALAAGVIYISKLVYDRHRSDTYKLPEDDPERLAMLGLKSR